MDCKQPDKEFPRLVCGYPLPCPHHTVLIDVDGVFPPYIPKAVKHFPKLEQRVALIEAALEGE